MFVFPVSVSLSFDLFTNSILYNMQNALSTLQASERYPLRKWTNDLFFWQMRRPEGFPFAILKLSTKQLFFDREVPYSSVVACTAFDPQQHGFTVIPTDRNTLYTIID